MADLKQEKTGTHSSADTSPVQCSLQERASTVTILAKSLWQTNELLMAQKKLFF